MTSLCCYFFPLIPRHQFLSECYPKKRSTFHTVLFKNTFQGRSTRWAERQKTQRVVDADTLTDFNDSLCHFPHFGVILSSPPHSFRFFFFYRIHDATLSFRIYSRTEFHTQHRDERRRSCSEEARPFPRPVSWDYNSVACRRRRGEGKKKEKLNEAYTQKKKKKNGIETTTLRKIPTSGVVSVDFFLLLPNVHRAEAVAPGLDSDVWKPSASPSPAPVSARTSHEAVERSRASRSGSKTATEGPPNSLHTVFTQSCRCFRIYRVGFSAPLYRSPAARKSE